LAGVPEQQEGAETPVRNSRWVIHCGLMEQLAGNRERTGWWLRAKYNDAA